MLRSMRARKHYRSAPQDPRVQVLVFRLTGHTTQPTGAEVRGVLHSGLRRKERHDARGSMTILVLLHAIFL